MNYPGIILINIFLLSFAALGDMALISVQEEGKYKTYILNINDSRISFRCNTALGTSYCEEMINDSLKEKNAVVVFEGDRVKSIQSLSIEENSKISCSANSKKPQLECLQNEICSKSIRIDAIINPQKKIIQINECTSSHLDQKTETLSVAKSIQNEYLNVSDVGAIIRKNCPSVERTEIDNLVNNLKKFLNANTLRNFSEQCLSEATDLNKNGIDKSDKIEHVEKLAASIMTYIESGLENCKTKNGPLFFEDKINFDRFVCLKSAEVRLMEKVNCDSNEKSSQMTAFSSSNEVATNASRDAAKNNDEKFQGKPIMIDSPPEISKPIPVKQTLAQIDKMVQDNGGTVSPEIAEKAGKLFNDSVYEPTRSAINYIDNKIFKADEASTAKYKSSNVASSGKRYQIGGNRNPASKPTTNKSNRSASVSSATAAGVMGQGVGTAATGSSNVIKTALGEEKETPSPGKAAKVDNQATEKALPLNNESQRSVGSGQQANNNLVANSASGSSRNALDNENPSLSPKASAEVNQLVGQIKTVESAEDLKSLLGLEENQEALRHLVKPVASGQDRSPASTADPLINKLKEYNIKLYDERTGKTIYSPEKTEYIMRLSDKGVRLLKPIGGTKK